MRIFRSKKKYSRILEGLMALVAINLAIVFTIADLRFPFHPEPATLFIWLGCLYSTVIGSKAMERFEFASTVQDQVLEMLQACHKHASEIAAIDPASWQGEQVRIEHSFDQLTGAIHKANEVICARK